MLCPSCNGKYDSKELAVRKLAECGHAICEKCWRARPVQSVVVCPTCGKRQVKQRSPERRSLKEQPKAEARGSEEEESSEEEEEEPFDRRSESESNRSELLCAAHCKGFEGFCLTCKALICLDCIFEKHKPHDFLPLDKARDRVASELGKKQLELEAAREECLQRLGAVKAFQEELGAALEKKQLEARTLMNELRRYIMLREQRLEELIREDFARRAEEARGLLLAAEKELHRLDSVLAALKHNASVRDLRCLGTPRLSRGVQAAARKRPGRLQSARQAKAARGDPPQARAVAQRRARRDARRDARQKRLRHRQRPRLLQAARKAGPCTRVAGTQQSRQGRR